MSSYVNKKTRAFREAGDTSLPPKRSEARLKTYPSATDRRAWCDDTEDRRQYILELIRTGSAGLTLGKYIPIEVIIDTLLANKNADIAKLKKKIDILEKLLEAYGRLNLTPEQQQELDRLKASLGVSLCMLDQLDKEIEAGATISASTGMGPSGISTSEGSRPTTPYATTSTDTTLSPFEESEADRRYKTAPSSADEAVGVGGTGTSGYVGDSTSAKGSVHSKSVGPSGSTASKPSFTSSKASRTSAGISARPSSASRRSTPSRKSCGSGSQGIGRVSGKVSGEEIELVVVDGVKEGAAGQDGDQLIALRYELSMKEELAEQAISQLENIRGMIGGEPDKRAMKGTHKCVCRDDTKLEMSAAAYKKALEDLQAQYKLLKNENELLADQVSGSGGNKSQINELKNRLQQLEQITSERDQLLQKVKELETKMKSFSNLPQQIDQFKQKSGKLISSISQERENLRKRLDSLDGLEDDVMSLLCRKAESPKGQGRQTCRGVGADLTGSQNMEKELNLLRKKSKEAEMLQVEHDRLTLKMEQMAREAEQNSKMLGKIQCLDNLKTERDIYKAKYEELLGLECECGTLKQRLEAYRGIEKERDNLRRQVNDLEGCIADLEDEIKRLVGHIDKLTTGRDEQQCRMREAITSMRAELERKTTLIQTSEEKLAVVQDQLENSIKGVSCETSCLRARIEELEKLIVRKDAQIAHLKKHLMEMGTSTGTGTGGDAGNTCQIVEELQAELELARVENARLMKRFNEPAYDTDTVQTMKLELERARMENEQLQKIAKKLSSLKEDENLKKMMQQSKCVVERLAEKLNRQYSASKTCTSCMEDDEFDESSRSGPSTRASERDNRYLKDSGFCTQRTITTDSAESETRMGSNEKIRKLLQKVRGLEEEMTESRRLVCELKCKLCCNKEIQAENTALRNEIKQIQENSRQEVEQFKMRMNKMLKDHETSEDAGPMCSRLQHQLDRAKQRISELEKQIMAERTRSCGTETDGNEEMKERIRQLELENKRILKEGSEQLNQEISHLRKCVCVLVQENEELREHNDEIHQAACMELEEVKTLKSIVDELEVENRELREHSDEIHEMASRQNEEFKKVQQKLKSLSSSTQGEDECDVCVCDEDVKDAEEDDDECACDGGDDEKVAELPKEVEEHICAATLKKDEEIKELVVKEELPPKIEKQPSIKEKQPSIEEKQPSIEEKQPSIEEKQPSRKQDDEAMNNLMATIRELTLRLQQYEEELAKMREKCKCEEVEDEEVEVSIGDQELARLSTENAILKEETQTMQKLIVENNLPIQVVVQQPIKETESVAVQTVVDMELQQLREENQLLKKQCEEFQKQLKDLGADLAKKDDLLAQFSRDRANSLKKMEDNQKLIEQMKQQEMKLKTQSKDDFEIMKATEAKTKQCEEELKKLKTQLEALSKQKESLQSELDKALSDIKLKNNQLEKLEKEMKDLSNKPVGPPVIVDDEKYKKCMEENKKLLNQVEHLNLEKANLSKKFDDLEKEQKNLLQQIKMKDKELEKGALEMKRYKEEVKHTPAQDNDEKQVLNSALNTLEKQLKDLDNPVVSAALPDGVVLAKKSEVKPRIKSEPKISPVVETKQLGFSDSEETRLLKLELEKQKQECLNTITKMKEQYDRDLQDVKRKNSSSIEKLQRSQEGAMTDIETQHDRESQNYKDEIRKLQEENRKLREEIVSLKKELSTEKGDVKTRPRSSCACGVTPPQVIPMTVPISADELKFFGKAAGPVATGSLADIARKILQRGIESLTFEELKLLHTETCNATANILEKTVPHIAACSREFGNDKLSLLRKIAMLETNLLKKQKCAQQKMISLQMAIRAEKQQLDDMKRNWELEKKRNIELQNRLDKTEKTFNSIQVERDIMRRQHSYHEDKVNHFLNHIRSLEMDLHQERENVKRLKLLLDGTNKSTLSPKRTEELQAVKLPSCYCSPLNTVPVRDTSSGACSPRIGRATNAIGRCRPARALSQPSRGCTPTHTCRDKR